MSSFNTFCVESFRINSETLCKLAKIFGSKIETKLELFVIPIKWKEKSAHFKNNLNCLGKLSNYTCLRPQNVIDGKQDANGICYQSNIQNTFYYNRWNMLMDTNKTNPEQSFSNECFA